MKKTILFFMLMAWSILGYSQNINKRPPFIELNRINEITLFSPISQLEVVGNGMDQNHHDSVSYISSKLATELILNRKHLFQDLRLHQNDSLSFDEHFSYGLLGMIERGLAGADYSDIRITPDLYSLLEKDNSRYGMMVFTSGFTRKKGNMFGEMLKSIGLGVLTMGMYYTVPLSYQSNVYVLVMDKELGHAVFFRKSEIPDSHPLKKKSLDKQFKYIFKDLET